MPSTPRRRSVAAALACTSLLAGLLVLLAGSGAGATAVPYDGPVPGVPCDAASTPESTQGRAPESEASGSRRDTGWTCNATAVSRTGPTGGYRVERYVDLQGHECAFFDTTLLFPKDAAFQLPESSGTWVMDMTDPARPVHTATLRTPAFQSPHESVRLNQRRGLLVADMGYPTYNPGFVDVYDVSGDCRNPQLRSSTPLGLLGHESGFAPDGFTFYVSSLYGHTVAAVDLTNPALPSVLWTSTDYQAHGIGVSDDGTRLYMTEALQNTTVGGYRGLTILDVSQIQRRVPNPKVTMISRLTWPHVGTPQNALPFTRDGRRYLAEIDEFGNGDNVGGARIIDIQDETKPFVVSVMRLAVNQKDAQTGPQKDDPGASGTFQGYRGHNCELPTRVDPTMLACSFIVSGLRVFDITDVTAPQEIAYFNPPYRNTTDPRYTRDAAYAGNFALSAPTFALERREIWYSDGNSGLYVVRLREAAQRSATLGTPAASPTPSATGTATPSATATATVTATPSPTETAVGSPTSTPTGTAPPAASSAPASGAPGSSPPGPGGSSPPAASSPPASGPPASSPPASQPGPSPSPGQDPDPTAAGPRSPLTLAVDRGTVVRGDRFVLTVTGQQYALVDVRCYSRPDTDYVSVRRGLRLPESGRLQVPLRPGTSSRCYVRYVEEDASATPSRRLLVRAAVTLQARPLSPGLVRFAGRSMTALPGQRVTVYRIADGRPIRAAVTRTRADGTWSLDRRFTGAGRFGFFARTDDTQVNLAGYTAIVAATVR